MKEMKRSRSGHGSHRLRSDTVILVSGTFSFWQEHRVEQTIEALQKLLPSQVTLLRDGAVARMAAEGLVPGDSIRKWLVRRFLPKRTPILARVP